MNRFSAVALSSLLAGLAAQALAQESLTDARFVELQARLAPDPDAIWRRIPWRIELLAAQREAAAQQKPLFIWAMDGHPLGCT